MANEILYSSIGDLVASEVISGEFLKLAGAEAALPNHPAIKYHGSVDGRGSRVLKIAHLGLDGYNIMSAVAEGTGASNTAFADGSTSVTIARQVLQREVGDLASITDATGALNIARFAASAYLEYQNTILNLVCNVIDGFTEVVDAGGAMDLDTFIDGIGALLAAGGAGPYLAILHGSQWASIVKDIGTNAGGSVAYDPATPELTAIRGPGYAGRLMGCDVFVTNQVVDATSKHYGAIMAADAVVWGDATPLVRDSSNQLLVGGKLLFERQRKASEGTDLWVSSAMIGVGKGVDARGVTLTSASA